MDNNEESQRENKDQLSFNGMGEEKSVSSESMAYSTATSEISENSPSSTMANHSYVHIPSTWHRLFAAGVDGIIVSFISSIFIGIYAFASAFKIESLDSNMIQTMAAQMFILTTVFQIFYRWGFFAFNDGVTPGKSLFGLKLISVYGEPITPIQALIRVLTERLELIFSMLPVSIALLRNDRRHLADLAAETKIVQNKKRDVAPYPRYVLFGFAILISIFGIANNYMSAVKAFQSLKG